MYRHLLNSLQEMRDTERRIGGLEREVSARDARLEEAAAGKASIGIELAQAQKRIQILESEMETLSNEAAELRRLTAGASGELAGLSTRAKVRDANRDRTACCD